MIWGPWSQFLTVAPYPRWFQAQWVIEHDKMEFLSTTDPYAREIAVSPNSTSGSEAHESYGLVLTVGLPSLYLVYLLESFISLPWLRNSMKEWVHFHCINRPGFLIFSGTFSFPLWVSQAFPLLLSLGHGQSFRILTLLHQPTERQLQPAISHTSPSFIHRTLFFIYRVDTCRFFSAVNNEPLLKLFSPPSPVTDNLRHFS